MSENKLTTTGRFMRQLGHERSVAAHRECLKGDRFHRTFRGKKLVQLAVQQMNTKMLSWVDRYSESKRGWNRSVLSMFIGKIEPEAVSLITVTKTLDHVMRDVYRHSQSDKPDPGCSPVGLTSAIGHAILCEIQYREIAKEHKGLLESLQKKVPVADEKFLRLTLKHAFKIIPDLDFLTRWDKRDTIRVGTSCLDILMMTSPLFYKDKRRVKGVKFAVNRIYLADELVEDLLGDPDPDLCRPHLVPTHKPPVPWESTSTGGYADGSIFGLKMIQTRGMSIPNALYTKDRIPHVYSATNRLQAVPWEINQDVLRVFETLWNADVPVAGLPDREMAPIPPRPPKSAPEEEYREWATKKRIAMDTFYQERMKRLVIHSSVSHAKRNLGQPIYFPHYLDWRGRAYPFPSFLNPQGGDVFKGLLKFHEGKPLTPEGLRWFKIHIANMWGEDKLSFEERLKWFEENQAVILQVAECPMDDLRWTEAEEPWQFLAAILDYRRYFFGGPDTPIHVPAQQDCSANGLQVLALLTRDQGLAERVNCVDGVVPEDIYTEVGKVVNKRLIDRGQLHWHTLAQGDLPREVFKPLVMNLPYGMTRRGQFDSVRKWVYGQVRKGRPEWPWEMTKTRINELIDVFNEVGQENFENAFGFLEHLKGAARKTHKKGKMPVSDCLSWQAPYTEFTVKPAYPNFNKKKIETRLFGWTTQVSYAEAGDILNKSKCHGSMVPNVVHSIDAAALAHTINHLPEEVQCATVHDCYVAHPNDMGVVRDAVRNAFYEVTKEFPKGDLEWPVRGTFDTTQVLDSTYFLS